MRKQTREPNRVRLAQVMHALRGNPLTIKEIATILKVKYETARRYVKQIENQEKIELHTDGVKPHKYRRDRKSTRLNSSHIPLSRMPSSA